MKREELQKVHDALSLLNSMVNCGDQHSPYSVNMTQAAFAILRKPLPPAEGAVPDNAAEQNKRMREWFKERTGLDDTLLSIHMEQIDVMLKGVQQQPTAEGAEEILNKAKAGGVPLTWLITPGYPAWNAILEAMQEFATLHAQRIAEKMVEENLVEFGNMIRDEPNGDIAALAEYFIRTINLKSREK